MKFLVLRNIRMLLLLNAGAVWVPEEKENAWALTVAWKALRIKLPMLELGRPGVNWL